jgi:hypothetical protein
MSCVDGLTQLRLREAAFDFDAFGMKIVALPVAFAWLAAAVGAVVGTGVTGAGALPPPPLHAQRVANEMTIPSRFIAASSCAC